MIANYHTHTVRCGHARGTEREYVETAIKNGLKVLGFADHAPYPASTYVGCHRMRMLREDTPSYFETLAALREEYKNDIKIYIGFEAEYFRKYYGEFKSFISQFPVDYLILGQHFIPEEQNGVWCVPPTSDPALLKMYVDICTEGLETGDYTYFAHPDVLNFVGDEDLYLSEMKRLADVAKKMSVPLEFNILGHHTGRHYPSDRFFRLAKENGNEVILGSDAHDPFECAHREYTANAAAALARLGITPIDTVEPKKPHFDNAVKGEQK